MENTLAKADRAKQSVAPRTNIEAAATSSSDHPNHYTYEVFLSFRGEDTRYGFTDHLHEALCRRGIKTFRDDQLNRGEDISQELIEAIEESRVSIIVFSQNYASSRWCLDELVKILECQKSKGQEVRPVFYKVDPSDVRNQTGTFGEAFAMLDQCKHKDSVDKWRAALKEAADLSGWPFKDGEYEAKFINNIVAELCARVVNPSCELHVAEHPIGLESCRLDVINRLLLAEQNSVRIVGIWGTGGIAKTTIAKVVFNSIRCEFEGSCFLVDVRSVSSSDSDGLAKLQETLLRDILSDSTLKVSSVDQGVSFIRTRMRHKKVLLILDDVSHLTQLKKLIPLPADCFGPGSRILITTRDARLLTAHQVDQVYEVKMLDDDKALKLFSLNAFKRNEPPGDYLKLVQRAVRFAQGLPLALIVLGSHLFLARRDEWEATLDRCKGDDPHREIRNVLKISYDAPHREIRNVLKISYDALGADLKEQFLDIACFFKGERLDRVKPILEALYDLKCGTGIEKLQEKALLRIDNDKIWMHDLIEEMGKDIACDEGEPGKRSRLWNYDDVYHVLTNNTGTNKVNSIELQWVYMKDAILNVQNFSTMKNLRYLFFSYGVKCSEKIDYLSNELRWLHWWGCPIQTFPSNFYPKKLVALIIPHSKVTRLWRGLKIFPNLTFMNLWNRKSLTFLALNGCKRLREIPELPPDIHIYGSKSQEEFLKLTNPGAVIEILDDGFLDFLDDDTNDTCSVM